MKVPYELTLYKPSHRHRSFRIYKIFRPPPAKGPKMELVVNEAIGVINFQLKAGKIDATEAERQMRVVLDSLRRKRDAERGIQPLFFATENERTLDRYVQEVYSKRESKAHSKKDRISDLKRAIGHIGEVSLKAAPHEDLVKKLKSNNLTPSVYNRIAGCLNSLLKFEGRGFIIHAVDDEDFEVTVWSADEIDKFTRSMPANERLLCLTAFATGMRWGECLGLKSKFIKRNPKSGRHFVWVDQQWNQKVEDFTAPKRGSRRDALILPQYVEVVKEWAALPIGDIVRLEHKAWLEGPRADASAPKLPEYSFHSLRHSYATYLLQQGVSLSLVARFLGNGLKVTEDYYAAYTFGDDLQLPDGL
jgi:integrase